MITIQDVQNKVRDLLINEFSGGAKIAEISVAFARLDWRCITKDDGAELGIADAIIEAVDTSRDMDILEYGWPMGEGMIRTKFFIYFKYKG